MTALCADLENRRQEEEIASENGPTIQSRRPRPNVWRNKIGTLIHKVLETYTQSTNRPTTSRNRQNGYFLGTQPATPAAICGGNGASLAT